MIAAEETTRLEYWLQSVKFAAPTAPIVIIGTHADHSRCTPEHIEYLTNHIQRYPFLWHKSAQIFSLT